MRGGLSQRVAGGSQSRAIGRTAGERNDVGLAVWPSAICTASDSLTPTLTLTPTCFVLLRFVALGHALGVVRRKGALDARLGHLVLARVEELFALGLGHRGLLLRDLRFERVAAAVVSALS